MVRSRDPLPPSQKWACRRDRNRFIATPAPPSAVLDLGGYLIHSSPDGIGVIETIFPVDRTPSFERSCSDFLRSLLYLLRQCSFSVFTLQLSLSHLLFLLSTLVIFYYYCRLVHPLRITSSCYCISTYLLHLTTPSPLYFRCKNPKKTIKRTRRAENSSTRNPTIDWCRSTGNGCREWRS